MIVILANVILVIGFCLATVGASGFARPPEPNAQLYFAIGMGVVLVGGMLHRKAKHERAHGHGGEGSAVGEFTRQVELVRGLVAEIDDKKAGWSAEELRQRIDTLLRDEYFDLASKNEDWIAVLGFATYSQVWDGVAVAERLLSRAWSMITDGYLEEGCAELPLARSALDRAVGVARREIHGHDIEGEPAHPGI